MSFDAGKVESGEGSERRRSPRRKAEAKVEKLREIEMMKKKLGSDEESSKSPQRKAKSTALKKIYETTRAQSSSSDEEDLSATNLSNRTDLTAVKGSATEVAPIRRSSDDPDSGSQQSLDAAHSSESSEAHASPKELNKDAKSDSEEVLTPKADDPSAGFYPDSAKKPEFARRRLTVDLVKFRQSPETPELESGRPTSVEEKKKTQKSPKAMRLQSPKRSPQPQSPKRSLHPQSPKSSPHPQSPKKSPHPQSPKKSPHPQSPKKSPHSQSPKRSPQVIQKGPEAEIATLKTSALSPKTPEQELKSQVLSHSPKTSTEALLKSSPKTTPTHRSRKSLRIENEAEAVTSETSASSPDTPVTVIPKRKVSKLAPETKTQTPAKSPKVRPTQSSRKSLRIMQKKRETKTVTPETSSPIPMSNTPKMRQTRSAIKHLSKVEEGEESDSKLVSESDTPKVRQTRKSIKSVSKILKTEVCKSGPVTPETITPVRASKVVNTRRTRSSAKSSPKMLKVESKIVTPETVSPIPLSIMPKTKKTQSSIKSLPPKVEVKIIETESELSPDSSTEECPETPRTRQKMAKPVPVRERSSKGRSLILVISDLESIEEISVPATLGGVTKSELPKLSPSYVESQLSDPSIFESSNLERPLISVTSDLKSNKEISVPATLGGATKSELPKLSSSYVASQLSDPSIFENSNLERLKPLTSTKKYSEVLNQELLKPSSSSFCASRGSPAKLDVLLRDVKVEEESGHELNPENDPLLNPEVSGDDTGIEVMREKLRSIVRPKEICPHKVDEECSCDEFMDSSDLMTTDVPYHTLAGCLSNEVLNEKEITYNSLEIPSWRHKVFTSCYSMEGTENLSDDVFEKRHARLEAEEKRRKRWDVQRIREQRQLDHLRENERKRNWLAKSDDDGEKESCRPCSLYPNASGITRINVDESLPINALGVILKKVQPSEFSLPWKDNKSSCGFSYDKDSSPPKHRRK